MDTDIVVLSGCDKAMAERHALQLENMKDESPETLDKLRISQRLEMLKARDELHGMDDIDFLLDHGRFGKFKGFKLCTNDLTIYKPTGQDISEGFYIRSDRGMFKYPQAFSVTQKLPMVREDPSTPNLDELGAWSVGSGEGWLIAKVMANKADSIRIIFADPESQIIRAIVSNITETTFNSLDVGNLLKVEKKWSSITLLPKNGQYADISLPENYALLKKCPLRGDDGYPETEERYKAIREDYIDRFVKGQYKEIQVKCFKFARRSFSYSDTVIECSWQALRKALQITLDSYNDDFTNLYPEILKGGHGFTFKVNGTNVKVDEKKTDADKAAVLYYVNGCRISAPDLTEVMEHALCFPNATKIYDDYLHTVSKVSLKFHRAVAKGLPFCMGTELLSVKATKNGKEIRRPGGMRNSGGGNLEIMLKINKTFGKKSSFDFLGKTRYIDEFDAFKRVADSSFGRSNRNVELPRIQHGVVHENFVSRLMAIDVDLVDESKYLRDLEIDVADFKEGAHVPNPSGYGTTYKSDAIVRHRAILNTDANNEIIRELHRQFGEAFSAGISEEYRILERSYELLQQVMKETGATCVEDDDEYFYKVTGLSGVRYKIKENDASVHLDTAGSEHICIVKASNDIDGYDYIASLIMALSQDKFTARNIHTLEGHVKRAARREAA